MRKFIIYNVVPNSESLAMSVNYDIHGTATLYWSKHNIKHFEQEFEFMYNPITLEFKNTLPRKFNSMIDNVLLELHSMLYVDCEFDKNEKLKDLDVSQLESKLGVKQIFDPRYLEDNCYIK